MSAKAMEKAVREELAFADNCFRLNKRKINVLLHRATNTNRSFEKRLAALEAVDIIKERAKKPWAHYDIDPIAIAMVGNTIAVQMLDVVDTCREREDASVIVSVIDNVSYTDFVIAEQLKVDSEFFGNVKPTTFNALSMLNKVIAMDLAKTRTAEISKTATRG